MSADAEMNPYPRVGVPHTVGIKADEDRPIEWQWYYTQSLTTQGITIPGATEPTYTPTADLEGKYLGCLVQFKYAGEIDAAPTLPFHQITL